MDLGPFLCVAVLAAPITQLQNLILLDRDISEGLRHLQDVLRRTRGDNGSNLSLALRSPLRARSNDLHWKTRLLAELQDELSCVYAFDEMLLQAMQDGLAVFARDGRLIFHNARWRGFCQRQNWNPSGSFSVFAEKLDQPKWGDIWESLNDDGGRLDTEARVGDALYQLRAMRLPSNIDAPSTDLILVVVTDLTARLERDRARAEALGFVTHELRTPLVSIQGYAEYLLRYPQQASGSDAARTIFRESGRLVAMINTYLDVLRLDVGSRPARRELFSLSSSIDEVNKVLEPLARASQIHISTAIAPEVPAVEGDPHLIAGALLNLLSNALKYSPPGSEVQLRVAAGGDMVVLEVRNAGPPIPNEELERLFEPFHRGHEQEGAVPGWGLGLAFVKRIAEEHGGRVEASSGPAEGTCFRLLLPANRLPCSEALS